MYLSDNKLSFTGKLRTAAAKTILLYIPTRFGGPLLKRLAFDQKYREGSWDCFDKEHSPEVVKVVEKYANKGRILDLGCGPGILASLLNPDSFEYYRGIDVSAAAIALAQKRSGARICFEVGDIQRYACEDTFDVIIFDESLYYVPFFRYRLLKKYARNLGDCGKFIVTVADPLRFKAMIKMIRRNFRIIEDRTFKDSKRLLLVFVEQRD